MADAPDLLVAGAGGGLVGALRGAQLGLEVVVVEANKAFRRGNNTSMSTAMIPGAGSRFQIVRGITDSSSALVADVMAKTHGQADPVVTRALARVSARLVEWLADDVGLPIELVTDFEYPGHAVHRCHTVPGRSGSALLGMLLDAVTNAGIDVITGARLRGLRPVAGAWEAELSYPDGKAERVRSGAVLLATNGFGAASDLVARYIPEIAGAVYHGSAESRGDALRIGESLGAATGFLDAYQGHGALTVGAGTLAGWATVMHGGIVINSAGQRFADETQGYSEFARLELEQPGGFAAIVIDQRIHDLCLAFEDFRQTVEMNAVRFAGSAEELAEQLGVPAAALRATLAETESAVLGIRSDPFGRTRWPDQPMAMPLAAIRVQPALFHTQGGLCVDEHARVLRTDGAALAGLYAAGGAAVGISGHGASGYLAGNGLLSALGLSFVAAEHASARAGRDL